ncbi:MAG: NAD(P)/FAD-dependent oxidoreductase, partial [Candidatus Aminicenantes bacterium]|nr:NAD(P)/FAD-dependent oxidoreductase [Candidatus Aminicenantes bacterium]
MTIAVIGNSAAAISAIESFRKYDQKSTIVLISREEHAPYSRVLLPYLLQDKIDYDEIFFRSAHFYDEMNVKTFLGQSVIDMDISQKELYLDSGEHIPFDRL